MINPNTDDDVAELREIYDALQEKAKELKVTLSWVEIKGTVFFMPVLPAKE